ncbi:unnamed protein product, partial [Vitis vinifera]
MMFFDECLWFMGSPSATYVISSHHLLVPSVNPCTHQGHPQNPSLIFDM